MTPNEIKANLTKEQWDDWQYPGDVQETDNLPYVRRILDQLAERNRLLKKLIDNASMDESMHFITVKISEPMFAIINAALKGVGEHPE